MQGFFGRVFLEEAFFRADACFEAEPQCNLFCGSVFLIAVSRPPEMKTVE